MKQCIDCGQLFADMLGACPNCGCPADCCRDVAAPAAASATAQAAAPMVQANAPATQLCYHEEYYTGFLFGRDWSHYIYECSVIAWHAISTKGLRFTGRATRREFWSVFFILPTVLLGCWFVVSALLFGLAALIDMPDFYEFVVISNCIISFIAVIAGFLISLAVAIRRLHDGNHCGWWSQVPVVVWLMCLQRSDAGANRYGGPDTDLGI